MSSSSPPIRHASHCHRHPRSHSKSRSRSRSCSSSKSRSRSRSRSSERKAHRPRKHVKHADNLEVRCSLCVKGETHLCDTEVHGDLKVDGNSSTSGNSQVGGNAQVGGSLNVGGPLTSGPQIVNGSSTVTGSESVLGNSSVTGSQSVGGSQTVAVNQSIGGSQQVAGNSVVGGNSTTNGNSTVLGNSSIQGNQSVNGNQTVNGSLTVNGAINNLGLSLQMNCEVPNTQEVYDQWKLTSNNWNRLIMQERKEFFTPLPSNTISFTGTISNDSLNVTAISSGGPFTVGMLLAGPGVPPNTYITALGYSLLPSAPQGNGGIGRYTITNTNAIIPLAPATSASFTATGIIYPGTDIDNTKPVYGYNTSGALVLNGGYDGSYSSNLNGFKVCYHGTDQNQLYYTKYSQVEDFCKRIVSFFAQRGYTLPPPDLPPQYGNLFMITVSSPPGINLPGGIQRIGLKFANNLPIASASVASNVCTLTLNANPSVIGLAATSRIYVSGFSGADNVLNGTFTVTATTATTVSFALTTANMTSTTFGFVTNADPLFVGSFLDVYASSSLFNNLTPNLYQDNPSRFLNGYVYPVRIPMTTNLNTYVTNYGVTPYAYYDQFKRMVSLNIPTNSAGYLTSRFSQNITRYNSSFVGSITGTTLTVTAVNSGTITFSSNIYVAGNPVSRIRFPSQNFSGNGGIGTYELNTSASFPAGTTFSANNDPFNQNTVSYLNGFVGSFVLMKRDMFNELVKSDYAGAICMLQCSPTVAISFSHNGDNPLSTTLQTFSVSNNLYSNNGRVYNGLTMPLINGASPSFDLYTYPNLYNAFVTATPDMGFSPDQAGAEAGDNSYSDVKETIAASSLTTLWDVPGWGQLTITLPPAEFRADSSVTYPENANLLTVPPYNTGNNNTMNAIMGHEFVHNIQNANGAARAFPSEAMALGLEYDGKLSNYSVSLFRSREILQMMLLLFRSNGFVFQAERNNSGIATYGFGVFWKYLETQFDTNNQIQRRVYDIAASSPNGAGPLLKANNFLTGNSAESYINFAGVLLAHQQALNELYSRNFKDWYFNFCVAMAFMRNNTSIPSQYHPGFPYWIFNTNYPGYNQIASGAALIRGTTATVTDMWNVVDTNGVIPSTYYTRYAGLRMFDNFILNPANITNNGAGVFTVNFATNIQFVQGLSVGDLFTVAGYGAGYNGTYAITGINIVGTASCSFTFTGATITAGTNAAVGGAIYLTKYTRQMRDMGALVIEIPKGTFPITSVAVDIAPGPLGVVPDFRIGMFQFTSDGTNLGQWIGVGPNNVSTGTTLFNMSTFTGTGKIRLVICNTNITDYATLPGGNPLDNYFANPAFTGTVSVRVV